MKKETLITKTSGAVVPFSEEKLRASLQRSGASKDIVDSILHDIKPKLFQGITTKKIYRMAFNLLNCVQNMLPQNTNLKMPSWNLVLLDIPSKVLWPRS